MRVYFQRQLYTVPTARGAPTFHTEQCVMRMGVKTSLHILVHMYLYFLYFFLTRLKYVAMWREMAMACKKGKPDCVDRSVKELLL